MPKKAGITALSEEEKGVVKDNMVELIIHAPALVRTQVGVSMRHVLEKEFPESWPGLLPKILTYIRSSDPLQLHGALHALRIIVKKYEL